MTRLLPRALLGLAALAGLLALLVAGARLPLGDTVLLPGTQTGGRWVVDGAAGELSLAVDVRNGGVLPLRVDGVTDQRWGPYAVRLGRGGPGGGVPELEGGFEPFLLWPGQQRLLVLHLTRTGEPAPLEVPSFEVPAFEVAATVLGVPRELAVELPAPVVVDPR